jgi:hypothetical protein
MFVGFHFNSLLEILKITALRAEGGRAQNAENTLREQKTRSPAGEDHHTKTEIEVPVIREVEVAERDTREVYKVEPRATPQT